MSRNRLQAALWLVVLELVSGLGFAAEFAWQRSVSVPTDGTGLYRLALDEQAYRRLHQNDLSDVALYDGLGQPLPLAKLSAPLSAPQMPNWRKLDWFVLPTVLDAGSDTDLHVYVERAEDGRLRRLETRLHGASAPQEAASPVSGGDWLVDMGEQPDARIACVDARVAELRLAFARAGQRRPRALALGDRWRTVAFAAWWSAP